MIWGALTEAIPTGFSSLYDWCVAQLAGKASKADVDPLLFAQYYPDGSVKSAAEFTSGIKYDAPDTVNRTITVKMFCNTGDSDNDNSNLEGRVVIPPFVDAQGNPYISDDSTRFKVVGVSGDDGPGDIITNANPTAIVAPNTVTTVGESAFDSCTSLATVSLPAAESIGNDAFYSCTSLATVSLPAAESIGEGAFSSCTSLTSVSLPAAESIGEGAFYSCTSLATVSLPAAESIGNYAFYSCTSLATVSLPAAESIGEGAFVGCTPLAAVSLPAAESIGYDAFVGCTSLTSVDFGDTPRSSVPTLGDTAFQGVPTSCKIIVPDAQYDAWIAASGWSALVTDGYKFLKHSEWEYARKYEVDKKADKPATFTTGNLAALDANGNPTDSLIPAANVAVKGEIPYNLVTKTISNGTVTLDDRASNAVTISTTLSPNTLTINFPTAPTGKLRDFAMRLNIAAGVTAPEIAWPQGVTLENNGGEVPEIADGGTGGSSTILYFSESENNGTTAKFTVKGETLTAIAQA